MSNSLSSTTVRLVSLVLLAFAFSFDPGKAQENALECEEELFAGCQLCTGELFAGLECEVIICHGNDYHFTCVRKTQ
ncbi:MAG: hypothetical protein F4X60_14070 [Gemmatimonadetes bacterium]|nr:hypothetical protein [Gemmatimonadota bacterium]MYB99663.1 hypothetical protein [Gemmatimonadota bacterium]